MREISVELNEKKTKKAEEIQKRLLERINQLIDEADRDLQALHKDG